MYHEDVDLSLRLRLGGRPIGIEPDARVDHEYEFHKGPAKWRLLERNRWATIIRTYPGALLALLAPALLATELVLMAVSLAAGWAPQKARAYADTLRALPRLLRERRDIQSARQVSAAGEFAAVFTPRLSSRLPRPRRVVAAAERAAARSTGRRCAPLLRARARGDRRRACPRAARSQVNSRPAARGRARSAPRAARRRRAGARSRAAIASTSCGSNSSAASPATSGSADTFEHATGTSRRIASRIGMPKPSSRLG